MTGPMIPLDQLKLGTRARIAAIDWAARGKSEPNLLRNLGFDEGVSIEPLHLGPFGKDPLAVKVGRMTVAIRKAHAKAGKHTTDAPLSRCCRALGASAELSRGSRPRVPPPGPPYPMARRSSSSICPAPMGSIRPVLTK